METGAGSRSKDVGVDGHDRVRRRLEAGEVTATSDLDTLRRHHLGKRKRSGRSQRRNTKKRRLRREGEPYPRTGRREEGRMDERDRATDGREDRPNVAGEADYERAMERPHDHRRWDQ